MRLETSSNVANLQRQETPTPPILASRCFQLIPSILFSVFASNWSQELYDALMTWIRRHNETAAAGKDRRSRPALFIKGDINPYYEATQTIDACVSTLKMLVTKTDVIAVTKDRTLALDLAKRIVAETQQPFSSQQQQQQQRFLDLYAAVGIVRAFNDVMDLNESYLFNPALVSIV